MEKKYVIKMSAADAEVTDTPSDSLCQAAIITIKDFMLKNNMTPDVEDKDHGKINKFDIIATKHYGYDKKTEKEIDISGYVKTTADAEILHIDNILIKDLKNNDYELVPGGKIYLATSNNIDKTDKRVVERRDQVLKWLERKLYVVADKAKL